MGITKTLMIVGATAVVAVAVTAGVAHMVKRAKERKELETAENPSATPALQGSGIRVTGIPRLSIARRQTPAQETPREDNGVNTDGPTPQPRVVYGTPVPGTPPVYGIPVTDGMRPASAHLPGLNLY